MKKPGSVATKWSKVTDVRLFHGKSTGNREELSHVTKLSVSSPLTSRPVVKGKAPRSKQERGQAAAVTAAHYRATGSSHWVSKDGIHEGKKEGEASLLTADQGKKEGKASLLTADQTLGIKTLKSLTSSAKLQDARSTPKSVLLLYTSNEQSEKEIKKTIPFTIASKRVKYI